MGFYYGVEADSKILDPAIYELEDFPTTFADSFLDLDAFDDLPTEANAANIKKDSEDSGAGEDLGGRVESKEEGEVGAEIEEHLGTVRLDGQSSILAPVSASDYSGNSGDNSKSNVVGLNEDEIKVDQSVGDGDGNSSGGEEEEDRGEPSSRKRGKNDDDEESELEGGEIRESGSEEMDSWRNTEDDDDDGGPIIAKNELEVLPPVPTVNAIFEPHHETIPVGTILSVFGTEVVVAGDMTESPLNEGSILWITERSPLGIIDEVYGFVESPYYVVRYNSENEVPSGIKEGTSISRCCNMQPPPRGRGGGGRRGNQIGHGGGDQTVQSQGSHEGHNTQPPPQGGRGGGDQTVQSRGSQDSHNRQPPTRGGRGGGRIGRHQKGRGGGGRRGNQIGRGDGDQTVRSQASQDSHNTQPPPQGDRGGGDQTVQSQGSQDRHNMQPLPQGGHGDGRGWHL